MVQARVQLVHDRRRPRERPERRPAADRLPEGGDVGLDLHRALDSGRAVGERDDLVHDQHDALAPGNVAQRL
jgi:hypothetical protein